MTNGAPLIGEVRALLRRATQVFADQPELLLQLREQLHRLDQPLRVAIAGKVKAGKSTLLNALVGEQIAATDSAECTRVVTWYQNGATPKVVLHPHTGASQELPVCRHDGALTIELPSSADEVERLVVDWPSQSLRETTLIDTPGMASTSTHISQRAVTFLTPADDAVTEADAVVYLMRHLHATDAAFLESFRDRAVSQASAANTVAVLSRADEVGGGRVDAMSSARLIARRYQSEPVLRGLCQTVVPVSGLLAVAGRTLRQTEYAALVALAEAPREEADAALLSADRFTAAGTVGVNRRGRSNVDTVSTHTRRELLDRFGLFGVRLAVTLIRQGADSPTALAVELVRRSGMHELSHVLQTLFTSRRDLLKARSALLLVETALARAEQHAAAENGATRINAARRELAAEVERIVSSAHELAELWLLSAMRSGEITLPGGLAAEAERLLGGAGVAPAVRLNLTADAEPAVLRQTALEVLARWQAAAENPLYGRGAAHACRTVARSCEGMLAGLSDAAENTTEEQPRDPELADASGT
ncbi:MAG: dynamin family protein [Mycobacteriales bacterium]